MKNKNTNKLLKWDEKMITGKAGNLLDYEYISKHYKLI